MKEIKLQLDDKSVEILEGVESLHRTSLINYGIRLLKGTDVFKTISGEIEAEDIGVINEVGVIEPEPEIETPKEKSKPVVAIDW